MTDDSASDVETLLEEAEEGAEEGEEVVETEPVETQAEEESAVAAADGGRLPRIQIEKGAVLVDGQPATAVCMLGAASQLRLLALLAAGLGCALRRRLSGLVSSHPLANARRRSSSST
jgi:hypothetical protein